MINQLKAQTQPPETLFSEMLDWSVEPEHVSRLLGSFATQCDTTVSVARIATLRDETTEDAKRRACETMTSTLDSPNVLEDESNRFSAIVGVEKVLTTLNELLPSLDELVI